MASGVVASDGASSAGEEHVLDDSATSTGHALAPDGLRAALPFRATRISDGLGWGGPVGERFRRLRANAVNLPAESHARVALQLRHARGSHYLWQWGDDKGEGSLDRPHLCLVPPGLPHAWRWDGLVESLHLSIPPGVLAEVADELGLDPARPLLAPVLGAIDVRAETALRAVDAELARPGVLGPLGVGVLVRGLTVHLLQAHPAPGRPAARPRPAPALPPGLVADADAYLRDHLADHLTLDALADAVGLSPSHLARRYKAATGLTPANRHHQLRVERAALLLHTRPHLNVAAVAQIVGYADQSHLHHQFKRRLNIAPGAFRREARR